MKNQTRFNWACVYCGKRNIDSWRFQFDVPKTYTSTIPCQKCGKLNCITWRLIVSTAEVKEEP